MLKEAGQVAVLAAANLSPGSPEVKKQARRLLRAVVAWRGSAVKATLDAGKEAKPRPTFGQAPKPPNLEARPEAKKCHSRLFFWASRYAWDKHDGLDAKLATRNLVLAVSVGYSKPTEKKPKPQPQPEQRSVNND